MGDSQVGISRKESGDMRSLDKEQYKAQDNAPRFRRQVREASQKSGRRRQRFVLNIKANNWHDVTAIMVQGSALGSSMAKCFSK